MKIVLFFIRHTLSKHFSFSKVLLPRQYKLLLFFHFKTLNKSYYLNAFLNDDFNVVLNTNCFVFL